MFNSGHQRCQSFQYCMRLCIAALDQRNTLEFLFSKLLDLCILSRLSVVSQMEAFVMSRVMDVQNPDVARATSGLAEFSSTTLATGISTITREVMKRGAAVITKHDEPVMVLMSIERYVQLEKAAAPNLDMLTRQFDEMYARMQAPAVAEKTIGALDLGAGRGKGGKPAASHRA